MRRTTLVVLLALTLTRAVPVRGQVVMVEAFPAATRVAVATVWLPDGSQVTPRFGMPLLVHEVAQVAVFTRAPSTDGAIAECSIWIDGQRVRTHRIQGAETVASCAWPDTDPGLSPK